MDRLQAMTTFVRVVETGSFSGAARQLPDRPARRLENGCPARGLAAGAAA